MTTPRQASLPRSEKPAKPHPDFPLTPHPSGRWCKKVRGRLRYFGTWDDPQAALDLWLDQKDDLLAGREPRSKEGLTIKELVNRFLASGEGKVKNGELKQRTWDDYDTVCKKIIQVLGRGRLVVDLRPSDFERLRGEFAKTHGPKALMNDITRSRVVFNFAYKNGLIEKPVFYGQGFSKPSAAIMRREKHKKNREFKAKQIRALLKIASPQLKAMLLLGINAGLGNNDCATLPLSALQGDWLVFPRPKTGIGRKCPLWPETKEALEAVIKDRPQAKDKQFSDYVFITRCHEPWTPKGKNGDSPITKETVKLLKKLGIHGGGLGFYALRHTFETIGGESGDQIAVDAIMGHAPKADDMSAIYRERLSNHRLFAVANHLRNWLFKRKVNSIPCRDKSCAAASPAELVGQSADS